MTSTGSLRGVAFGLGIAAFAAYQQFKLPVVLPVLLERYGYDRTLAGGFVSVYAVAGLLLSVYTARVVTRTGAVAPIMTAMGLMLAGSGASLLAPQLGWLMLAGRGLEGMGFAILGVCGPVLANANAGPRQLSMVIGLTAAWIPVGQLTATALAPIALASFGWSSLWWLAMVGCIAFVLWLAVLRRDPCVILAPGQSQPTPVTSERASASVPGAAQLTVDERFGLTVTAAIFGIWSGQYFAYMTWLPQYLVEVHQFEVGGALLGYLLPVVLVIGFNLLTGLALRAGATLGTLLVVALASQSIVWWSIPLTDSGVKGLISLLVYGCGAGVVPACLFGIPSALVGTGPRAVLAFGTIMTGRNLGVLIGPVLLAQLIKSSGQWTSMTPVFGGLTTVCLLLAIGLARRLR